MILIRTAISTPKRISLFPRCSISTQQLSPFSTTAADHTFNSQQSQKPSTLSQTLNKQPLTSTSTWPRPTEIIYQPKVNNFLNLYGIIQIPIHSYATPDGKIIAATIIAQKDGAFIANSSNSFLIPLVFEGDLAHSVAWHAKPYDCVYVSAKFSLNPLPFVLSENQGEFYLMGNQINFVQGFGQKNVENNNVVVENRKSSVDNNTKVNTEKKNAINVGGTTRDEYYVVNYWRDLVLNPRDWWDYREKKSSGSGKANYPDLKHKTSGASLWLNTAPIWVLAALEGLNLGKRNMEDSWKDLVENPDKWWDNRPRKTNIKAPDFIRKLTLEGLWLNTSPKWVLAVPEGLDVPKAKMEDRWKDLVENPDKWWDNRPRKTNIKAPDFIRKLTFEGLWLNTSPKWVVAVPEGLNVPKGKKEDRWKDLVENPDKWWDIRPRKFNVNAPNFKHKKTGDSLWLGSCPNWLLSQLPC